MCIASCSIIRTINLSEPPLVLISSDNRSSTVVIIQEPVVKKVTLYPDFQVVQPITRYIQKV